mgnify:CR=1 FL=1|tara:strand:+ start:60959 stop:61222 length:264 start_codon:yes stop_codon:yes gene_type:complete
MGSGFAQFMISSLKNNKRGRPNGFKTLNDKGVKYSGKTELFFEKKTSPLKLKKIRERIQEENRIRTRNRALFIVIFISILIYFIGFY